MRCQEVNFPIQPVANRVILKPVDEPASLVYYASSNQMWRGQVLRADDSKFLSVGDYVRFQPMKRRYDLFSWKGQEYISVQEGWIYLKEREDGMPIATNGNRLVATMIDDRLFKRNVIEFYSTLYHRVKVVCPCDFPKLSVDDIVLINKSKFWQFYRVKGEWLFVAHASTLLAVET